MAHPALLLLMLKAANVDLVFIISLKRSTPNLLLSTKRRPITPSKGGEQIRLRKTIFYPQRLCRLKREPVENERSLSVFHLYEFAEQSINSGAHAEMHL